MEEERTVSELSKEHSRQTSTLKTNQWIVGFIVTVANLCLLFFGFGQGCNESQAQNALSKQAFQYEMQILGGKLDRYMAADSVERIGIDRRLTAVEQEQIKQRNLFAVIIENFKLKKPSRVHRADWPAVTEEAE